MRLIIPLFIMSRGCPHRCVFCNERITAGDHPEKITEEMFGEVVSAYLRRTKRKPDRIQIAFYGGNFTGMARREQGKLLRFAEAFFNKGVIDDIRISTRPDWLDGDGLDFLKEFHVRTVEIGVQSLVDDVLVRAGRGHSSADVAGAVRLLRERGMEVGMHLMVGLPGDTPEKFACTIERTIALRPDMVRIHPTLALEGTVLADWFRRGDYVPMTMPEAVEACKFAVQMFAGAGIPVIRVGLQTTPQMEAPGGVVAGPFHPAFRSLVDESIFLDMASSLLRASSPPATTITLIVSPKDTSSLRGQRNRNIHFLKERFGLSRIIVSSDAARERGSMTMMAGDRIIEACRWGAPMTQATAGKPE